jgi:hypothetical protein
MWRPGLRRTIVKNSGRHHTPARVESRNFGALTTDCYRLSGAAYRPLPLEMKLLFQDEPFRNDEFFLHHGDDNDIALLARRRNVINLAVDDDPANLDLFLEERHLHRFGAFLQVLSNLNGADGNCPFADDEVLLDHRNGHIARVILFDSVSADG